MIAGDETGDVRIAAGVENDLLNTVLTRFEIVGVFRAAGIAAFRPQQIAARVVFGDERFVIDARRAVVGQRDVRMRAALSPRSPPARGD